MSRTEATFLAQQRVSGAGAPELHCRTCVQIIHLELNHVSPLGFFEHIWKSFELLEKLQITTCRCCPCPSFDKHLLGIGNHLSQLRSVTLGKVNSPSLLAFQGVYHALGSQLQELTIDIGYVLEDFVMGYFGKMKLKCPGIEVHLHCHPYCLVSAMNAIRDSLAEVNITPATVEAVPDGLMGSATLCTKLSKIALCLHFQCAATFLEHLLPSVGCTLYDVMLGVRETELPLAASASHPPYMRPLVQHTRNLRRSGQPCTNHLPALFRFTSPCCCCYPNRRHRRMARPYNQRFTNQLS